MKKSQPQQVSPVVATVCILAVLGVLAFIGARMLRPASTPSPSVSTPPASTPVINGVKAPPNVPSYYWQEHAGGQGQPAPR